MRRRRLTEAEQRQLLLRQGALTALTKHPSWPDLLAELEKKRERIEKITLAKTLRSRDEIDARDIYYLRGFLGGIDYMVEVCEGAETALENYLKTQGVEAKGEVA